MSLTSRLIIPKNILQKVKNRRNPTHSLINKKSTILSTNFKTKEDELNTSILLHFQICIFLPKKVKFSKILTA